MNYVSEKEEENRKIANLYSNGHGFHSISFSRVTVIITRDIIAHWVLTWAFVTASEKRGYSRE